MLDRIALTGMTVECIVGVYGSERVTPQPLAVNVELFLNTRRAAAGAGLAGSVDYGRLAGELSFILKSCRFGMLESAAEVLARYILAPPTQDAPRVQVEAVTVKLTKPEVGLAGSAIPTLEIHRRRSEMHYLVERKAFGEVDVLFEGDNCGFYRLRVKSGGFIPTHVHRVMEERELVLGSGLLLQGAPVKRGTAFKWPKGFPHRYDNPTSIEQSILCIDSPPFMPDDEIVVSTAANELTHQPGEPHYPNEDSSDDANKTP